MALLLGVDTGGTYTDAVLLDDATDTIIASAKSLTTRPDLSGGIADAIDTVMRVSDTSSHNIGMVSLSTTLATNALVEGQGGRIALVFIGFDRAELSRSGLSDAIGADPVIALSGGHTHAGAPVADFDADGLRTALADLPPGITGFAIASSFATRNAAHEIAARDIIREATGKPATCSHELSQALGGPKRALTAVLNARLIGLIDGLISGCQAHLDHIGITARLMVVRGDGALISADLARTRPIETILSGPAASIAGAAWLTGATDALVSDIGGTTTDICLLRGGKPKIDPLGARVGPYRTMVEAVAMRTFGLGGDSEVHVQSGLTLSLHLGPRRLMPVSLLSVTHPDLVHPALDRAATQDTPAEESMRFVVPQWDALPQGLDNREAAIVTRLADGPLRLTDAVQSRVEAPALDRLVRQGFAMICGVTPSDAAHVTGQLDAWDGGAARKALGLFARRRMGSGDRLAASADALAAKIIDQLTAQTAQYLLEAAFAEDNGPWRDLSVEALARHPLLTGGLDTHSDVIRLSAGLNVPIVGLGASARSYYGAVGKRLHADMLLPEHGGVANAIGAVVGQVSMQMSGTVTSTGTGSFTAHLPNGPERHTTRNAAFAALRDALTQDVSAKARAIGVDDINITTQEDIKEIQIEGQPMFIEATIRVVASGRPRIAQGIAGG